MKWQTISTAALLTVLVASVGLAQCNRSGGNTSPSAGNFGPSSQFTSFSNPYQLQSQRAELQRKAMLAQQQLYRQALSQRSSSQLARQRRSSSSDAVASSSSRLNARQVRLREQNAEKAYALAVKAEKKGRTSTAEKYYRRAIRIAGEDSGLSERAEIAIAAMSDDGPVVDDGLSTILASLEL